MKKLVSGILAFAAMFSFACTAMAEFDEDVPIKRGEFISVVYRIEEALVYDIPEYPDVFSDVEADSIHADAIAWAAANGIINGVSENLCAPDEVITREQMATIMKRYYDYKGISSEEAAAMFMSFADNAEISDYAVDGVKLALLEEVLKADENGNINPKTAVIGDDLASFIGNLYDKVKK